VNGVLKDKVRLLSLYNINRVRQGDFADYLDAAISEAGNDIFKKRIIAFKDANGFLANAFPFALPDKNGRVYRLSDFKGKMVIMDFWFTGCHGCVGMGAVLKPIALFYKSNPNVVFISMCIDRNRDLWLKSLEEEKYCSKDEINLLAGMDRESSIYKHYDLQGCPTLIVISKEGKIISAAPPDPRIDAGVFKTFINKYL
jgi:thiol-disulfide isomerase/thioredoxin